MVTKEEAKAWVLAKWRELPESRRRSKSDVSAFVALLEEFTPRWQQERNRFGTIKGWVLNDLEANCLAAEN